MALQRETYMSIVGGLLWLANMTRPDIAHAASQLSRCLTNPGQRAFGAAIRVLLYLKYNHHDYVVKPDGSRSFEVFVDSNWSSSYSCSGSFFLYHGCIFHWFSKMQKSVSLSSAEAEFFGAMLAARELLFFRDLLLDLWIELDGPTTVWCDSKSAVDMSFDPVAFKNTKHIMRAASFLRDLVLRASCVLKHLPGKHMIADILTKACARPIFIALITALNDCTPTSATGTATDSPL